MKLIKNSPRIILNEIKWTKDLKRTEIWYVHRGAPNNTKILSGKDIVTIGKSFFDTSTATIPYHRIFKIVYEGKVLFIRSLSNNFF
jgi:uncharacterized protein (UPF0248 family)